jgi:phosphoesterase RecJ-like protein
VVVDTNSIKRIGTEIEKYIESIGGPRVVFIDHHPASDELKKQHLIKTESAATGQLVGELIEHMGLEFDAQLALPLYTAILIDTSSFRYPTVSGDTHRLLAKLVDTGVKPPDAYNGIYGTKKVSHMHLLGNILQSANMNQAQSVAWIVLNRDVLERYKTDIEDTHAFINHLLVLDKIKVAAMFRDDGHELKVSFRSAGDIDVGAMARSIGGGGHSHSAATIIELNGKKLPQAINETISAIEEYLSKQKT